MSKYIHAQKLNKLVTFQRRSGARDAANQPLPNDWVTVCRVWCDINTVTGNSFVDREFVAADREVSRPTTSIRTRKRVRDDIKADMRAVHGRTVYEIRVVLPDKQDDRFIDIGCASGAVRDG